MAGFLRNPTPRLIRSGNSCFAQRDIRSSRSSSTRLRHLQAFLDSNCTLNTLISKFLYLDPTRQTSSDTTTTSYHKHRHLNAIINIINLYFLDFIVHIYDSKKTSYLTFCVSTTHHKNKKKNT
jgi:hypothetical protein